MIEELGARFGEAPALISPRRKFQPCRAGARANRYARWALAQGIAKGDTVCLLMPNRPEYLAIWLGLTRIGAVVALINTNLTGDGAGPLHHRRRAQPYHRGTRLDAALEGLKPRPSSGGMARLSRH